MHKVDKKWNMDMDPFLVNLDSSYCFVLHCIYQRYVYTSAKYYVGMQYLSVKDILLKPRRLVRIFREKSLIWILKILLSLFILRISFCFTENFNEKKKKYICTFIHSSNLLGSSSEHVYVFSHKFVDFLEVLLKVSPVGTRFLQCCRGVARGIVFSSLTIFWASNVYAESYILRLWQTAIKILAYCCGHLFKVAVFGNPWLWLIFVDSCHRLSIENHFENHSANHIRDGWSGSKQTWHTQFRIRELWLDSVFVNCKVYSLITIYVKRFFPPCSWRIYLKILINKYCVEKNGCTVCLCISLFGSGSVISEWSDPIRLRSRNSPGTHKTPRGDKNFLGLKNTFSFQFCINC